MNLQKDDFLFADLKWVKGIEYLTSIVKLMLPEEVKKVWENVKSPNFQMPVRSIVNQIREFQKIFKKETKDFHNSTSNKERTLKQLENDLVRMITSFTKTAGEIFPQDLLEHTDDNLLE